MRTASTQRRASSAPLVLRRAKEATKGVKVGRPMSYSPELCDRAVAIGMKGGSWAAIATAFGLGRETLSRWDEQFPEFRVALARARTAAQAWHEAHGRKGLRAKHYQGQVLKTLMSGQFTDYAEQKQQTSNGGFDLNVFVAGLAGPNQGAQIQVTATPQRQLADVARAVEPLDVVLEPSDNGVDLANLLD